MHFFATVLRNLRDPKAQSPHMPRNANGETPIQEAKRKFDASANNFTKQALKTLQEVRQVTTCAKCKLPQ